MTTNKLKVPDTMKLSKVQEFCDLEHPYLNNRDVDQLFVGAMRNINIWHKELSPFYAKLLNQQEFDPDKIRTIDDCAQIPWIFASFLKQHELLSVSRENIETHLTSSGTTGQKSQMFFDHWSLASAQKMLDQIFKFYGWVTPNEKANYLLYSYEQKPGMKLGTAYTDHYLCKYAPINRAFSALRFINKERHEFDSFGCIASLESFAEEGLPVRIFGFPAFLYFTLKQMRELSYPELKLSKQSLVFLGGGWKSHQNQAVSKVELYDLIEQTLGIPNERIRDGFGSVEHCIPYVECSQHRFHVPTWSRVFIRDVKTLKPLGHDVPGFLHFVSPYMTSVPAHSVVMGDIASIHGGKDCQCELETPYFVIHGRAGTSKNKSCAIAASELLRRFA